MSARVNRLIHRAAQTSVGLIAIEIWSEEGESFHSATRFTDDGWEEYGEEGHWTPRDLADSLSILGVERDEAEQLAEDTARVLDDRRSAAAEPVAPLSLRWKIGFGAAVAVAIGVFAFGLVAAIYLVATA
jgi:hypothetical protein